MGLEGDFEAIKAKVEQIKSDLFQWEKWYTDPKLVAQVRQAVEGETPLFQDPTDGKAKPLTPENIKNAFNIDEDKAQAVHAVMAASAVDLSKVSVTRGGKPGEGSLRQLTMEFMKWFGTSKVVDKKGKRLDRGS